MEISCTEDSNFEGSGVSGSLFGKPVVSVVTPVFNGGRYLAECIESVAAQSFVNLEHVIVDNASTDDTRTVAAHYAARDNRVRVIECGKHVPIIANWNRALGFMSPESNYVWVLPADDVMLPDALTRMVGLASQNPNVGIVASLRWRGDKSRIECGGLPTDQVVFSGHEIVRLYLRKEVFGFSPTGCVIRRDLIDSGKPFYPEKYVHADIAAFFEVMDKVDFGFVHKILMFSREHEDTITTTICNRNGTPFREGLLILHEYGPRYFSPDELTDIEAKFLRRYYRYLVRSAFFMRDRDFFSFHADGLRQAGRLPNVWALAQALMSEMAQGVLRPHQVIRHVRARLTGRYIL